MAFVLIVSNVFLIVFSFNLNVEINCSIDGVCVVPRAPAVMTMSGFVFHPIWLRLSIMGLIFLDFVVYCFLWEPIVCVCEFIVLYCEIG